MCNATRQTQDLNEPIEDWEKVNWRARGESGRKVLDAANPDGETHRGSDIISTPCRYMGEMD
ncbi:uncharacterized protein N7477_000090 [Penicillium maclennaniae]|uniref:uncharacterized protein n=1 Tax=Penicillium maclennaniae TaxID=1343394 RepID=UPI00254109BD|nr:uncharacterized protein N7477_000090 [Penicillium maclennaniae]KAJ5683745.1 hypothetical protein N7477_000090 [Penicillium maclennaniae]